MKRELLEQYLDKRVEVTLFDGDVYKGVLRQCGTERVRHDNNLYLGGKKRYFVERENGISAIFRCSHVTKLEEMRKD